MLATQSGTWAADQPPGEKEGTAQFGLSPDVGSAVSRQADRVRQQLEQQTDALFQREPLGFDWQTANDLLGRLATLPLKIPQLLQAIIDQSRLLGVVGSLLILVSKEKQPVVRFVEFGDSSINFDLLVWINVRTTPRRKVRSALYFAIFEALAQKCIEIPFPQRDIHLRSTVAKIP